MHNGMHIHMASSHRTAHGESCGLRRSIAQLGTIQNAGSFWTMYFTLETLTVDVVPWQARVNLARVEACGVPEVDNAILAVRQAVETVAQICTVYKLVLRRYDYQRGDIVQKIATMVRGLNGMLGVKTRNKRDAPLDFMSKVGKSVFGLARNKDLRNLARMIGQMQQQIDGMGETIIRNQDLLEAAFKLQEGKINVTKQAVIGNQHTINRLIDRMQDVQRSVMNAQQG